MKNSILILIASAGMLAAGFFIGKAVSLESVEYDCPEGMLCLNEQQFVQVTNEILARQGLAILKNCETTNVITLFNRKYKCLPFVDLPEESPNHALAY